MYKFEFKDADTYIKVWNYVTAFCFGCESPEQLTMLIPDYAIARFCKAVNLFNAEYIIKG